jgi:glycosyltransferase involved in cell wall biosynthesis
MNILIINSAKEWGGTEKWAVNTALGLADRGHTVFFGCRGTLYEKPLAGSMVRLAKFPFANNIDVVSVVLLRSFMRKHRIDVVMPTKQREYFLAGLAAQLFTRAKVAAMFAIERPIHNLRNWIAFCTLFDIVFVCAQKIIDVLARTKGFNTAKCRLVYMGVESIRLSDDIRKKQRKAWGFYDNDICIMAIGRLCPQKGFDYAIKAFALFARKHSHVKLVIVGGGDGTVFRQQADKAGVADRLILTGFRDDISELVQAADIYWLTSRSEGVPNTMLEAMAAKVPVVAFDVSAVAEVVRNNTNGLLVPFEGIHEMAAATIRLIEDHDLRQRIGEAGCQTVRREFSLEKMIDDTEKYLKELCPAESRK